MESVIECRRHNGKQRKILKICLLCFTNDGRTIANYQEEISFASEDGYNEVNGTDAGWQAEDSSLVVRNTNRKRGSESADAKEGHYVGSGSG